MNHIQYISSRRHLWFWKSNFRHQNKVKLKLEWLITYLIRHKCQLKINRLLKWLYQSINSKCSYHSGNLDLRFNHMLYIQCKWIHLRFLFVLVRWCILCIHLGMVHKFLNYCNRIQMCQMGKWEYHNLYKLSKCNIFGNLSTFRYSSIHYRTHNPMPHEGYLLLKQAMLQEGVIRWALTSFKSKLNILNYSIKNENLSATLCRNIYK